LRKAVLSAAALALLAACDKPKGGAERVGQKIDQAAQKAGEHLHQAADQVGQKLEQAGEGLRDAAHSPAPAFAPASQAQRH
jgi:hyperosmotically inducible protein